jgi:hypothetical protein
MKTNSVPYLFAYALTAGFAVIQSICPAVNDWSILATLQRLYRLHPKPRGIKNFKQVKDQKRQMQKMYEFSSVHTTSR